MWCLEMSQQHGACCRVGRVAFNYQNWKSGVAWVRRSGVSAQWIPHVIAPMCCPAAGDADWISSKELRNSMACWWRAGWGVYKISWHCSNFSLHFISPAQFNAVEKGALPTNVSLSSSKTIFDAQNSVQQLHDCDCGAILFEAKISTECVHV
jgi:hypothetical protein